MLKRQVADLGRPVVNRAGPGSHGESWTDPLWLVRDRQRLSDSKGSSPSQYEQGLKQNADDRGDARSKVKMDVAALQQA